MKRFLFASLFSLWGVALFAQFTPGPVFPQDTAGLFKELATRIQFIDPEAPEEHIVKYAQINEKRLDELRDGIRDSLFLFHPGLQTFLDDMMTEIATANGLDVDPLILIRRSQVPNAASYGDGIFTVNIGLFQSLGTADRIAFVLCHEMAHDQLGHQRKGMLEFCERNHSMKAITKQLNRRRTMESRRKSLIIGARTSVYNSYRLKRNSELEADGLGLKYYTSLGYSMRAIGSALSTLEGQDLCHLQDVDFRRLLQTESYPLKEKWLAEPTKMFGGSFGTGETPAGFWAKDSVSTHPIVEIRQAGLAALSPPAKRDTTVPEKIHLLALTVDQEMIRAQTETGTPGLAVINGLRLLASDPENPTFRALLGNALLRTCQSIEDHDFDEAVPPESYFSDPNAGLVIRMFRQMRESELRKFTLAWIRGNASPTGGNEMSELLKKTEEYFIGFE